MKLHPGVAAALQRLGSNELDVARAIRAGELPSPQRIDSMALFALRVTGTGVAYRGGLKEYAWRNPALYLTDEFLARCNGLPVILEHPAGQTMTSGDYADRNIGSVFLPYISGDEVWCIARIYDAAAADLMEQGKLSTSPCVVFRDPSVNARLQAQDGRSLLFEGAPSSVDHLAICERGVWDKGSGPSGVRADSEDENMADAAKKPDAVKKDNDTAKPGDDRLDQVLQHLTSMSARLDALEGKKADAEETEEEKLARDAARREREANEGESARRDGKRSDSFAQRRADEAATAKIQARADAAFSLHGKRAPAPLVGESPLRYRVRMANELRTFSPALAGVNLGAIADADEAGFADIESRIYADSDKEAARPTMHPEGGEIYMRERRNPDTGTPVREFFGARSFVREMSPPPRPVMKFHELARAG